MSTVTSKFNGGVNVTTKYTVTAQDVTDGAVVFDFGLGADLAVNIQVVTTAVAGIFVPLVDAVITYPSAGKVSIADGAATFALVADQVITVVGGINSADLPNLAGN